MLFAKGTRLVMAGDSITDCGRGRPIGEPGNLGNGYVALVDAMLRVRYPESSVLVLNSGTSGDTTQNLLARWQDEVLAHKPDWVTIMIGINDVWRHFDAPLFPERYVPIQQYEANLHVLLDMTLPEVNGIILATPYFIEPNRADPMRAMMDEYGKVVKRLAEEYSLPMVDTQAAYDSYLAKGHHPVELTWDRIHPGMPGHMLMAEAFMQVIGE